MEHLTTVEELEAVLNQDQPVILFKHSTRCTMSTFADNEYKKFSE